MKYALIIILFAVPNQGTPDVERLGLFSSKDACEEAGSNFMGSIPRPVADEVSLPALICLEVEG